MTRREQDQTDTDLSRDVESPSGEWGGPPRDERGALGADDTVATSSEDASDDGHGSADTGRGETADTGGTGDAADTGDAAQQPTMVGDIEDFAATEPVLAEDQTPPVEREGTTESRDENDGGPAAGSDDDTRVAGGSHAVDPSSTRDDADVATASPEDDGDSAGTDDVSRSADAGDTSQQPTMVGDIEDFAATEPVLAGDQSAPVEPEGATQTRDADRTEADRDGTATDGTGATGAGADRGPLRRRGARDGRDRRRGRDHRRRRRPHRRARAGVLRGPLRPHPLP